MIQYARHRAALGANFHRADWSSLPDLPAPPNTCKKRMASLKSDIKSRKALMRLCNLLGERYAKLLEKIQNSPLDKNDCRLRGSAVGGLSRSPDGCEFSQETHLEEESWDDFDNRNLKIALDEVLRCQRMAKLEASKVVGPIREEWQNLSMNAAEYVIFQSIVTFCLLFDLSSFLFEMSHRDIEHLLTSTTSTDSSDSSLSHQ